MEATNACGNYGPWTGAIYISRKTLNRPGSAKAGEPTDAEIKAQTTWDKGDTKTRCRIELAISDAEMVHIMGARTAREMWEQLCTVKESKGRLGLLATRRALFRATAEKDVIWRNICKATPTARGIAHYG